MIYGVFTLPDTDTDTDKKMGSIAICRTVHTGRHRHSTDANGLQTHFVGIGQCEHSINSAFLSNRF